MLAEFFLTPDVFDVPDDVLRSRLNEMRQMFFPRGGTSSFVACQLGEEAWRNAVIKRLKGIKNKELKSNAWAFFCKLIDHASVVRTEENARSNWDEKRWIHAASKSSSLAPLDGTVATISDSNSTFTFDKFASDELLEKYSNPRLVERLADSQDSVLRTLCLHSDWLFVRLPYLKGGVDDEIATLKQILKATVRRSAFKPPSNIEIHVCPKEKIEMTNLLRNVKSELESLTVRHCDWTLKPVPKFIDRVIIGGEWANISERIRERRVRWLLTMTHVAVTQTRSDTPEKCTWALHGRKSAHETFQLLMGELSEIDSASEP
jgi:hypothetical protein